jgi:hypothetical protein
MEIMSKKVIAFSILYLRKRREEWAAAEAEREVSTRDSSLATIA